ncbi:hypothetical protein F2Q69_00013162 [Brassica cretica]|uniref:Uncharacterized protein n=1 Tax=Brassica cretica TaxID=69181 RepID=A0A8S9R865_BRACR|nr:hypothetical protein F2Q69_00013162 [Brassica cretica]
MKGQKRKNPSTTSGGVSSRTRARKAVSDGTEPAREDVVHQDSTPVRETTVVLLSVDSESEDITRARKAVSDGTEPAREDVVHQDSTPVRETTVVLLSVDSESEDMSAVSSKVINNVLVPTVGEEIMMARIIDEEPEYH